MADWDTVRELALSFPEVPDAYFTSPHYNGYPAVQIRLEGIGNDELQERLEDAWLIQAPKRLAAAYIAQTD